MKLLTKLLTKLLSPKEPPDPATVSHLLWNDAVRARSRLGLKPWPYLPSTEYRNTVIGICQVCGINIYGCQAISWGAGGTRCGDCFTPPQPPEDLGSLPQPPEDPADRPPQCK